MTRTDDLIHEKEKELSVTKERLMKIEAEWSENSKKLEQVKITSIFIFGAK